MACIRIHTIESAVDGAGDACNVGSLYCQLTFGFFVVNSIGPERAVRGDSLVYAKEMTRIIVQ